MSLSNFKNSSSFDIEEISTQELNELRVRETEEDFDFEELKKFVKLNKKLTNV
jgi:hypothetical protein